MNQEQKKHLKKRLWEIYQEKDKKLTESKPENISRKLLVKAGAFKFRDDFNTARVIQLITKATESCSSYSANENLVFANLNEKDLYDEKHFLKTKERLEKINEKAQEIVEARSEKLLKEYYNLVDHIMFENEQNAYKILKEFQEKEF